MNAAQRRQLRRQLAREWPVGTAVGMIGGPRRFAVIGPSKARQGYVMVSDERGRHFVHPHRLWMVPTTQVAP